MPRSFGLGYTLFDLDRHREAYTHLRRYSEIAPHNSWAWLWFGRAAEALGEQTEEAVSAYRRAVRREREGSFRTDAQEAPARAQARRRADESRKADLDGARTWSDAHRNEKAAKSFGAALPPPWPGSFRRACRKSLLAKNDGGG